MRSLTQMELQLIHPHNFWKFKCGMFVEHGGEECIFLGYCADNKTGVLADRHGNKRVVFLQEINQA